MKITANRDIGESVIAIRLKDDSVFRTVKVNAEKFLKTTDRVTDLLNNYAIIDTRIYGGFYTGTLEQQRKLEEGEILELFADKENDSDGFAVGVRKGREVLGFLKKQIAWQMENPDDFRCIVLKRYLPERGSTVEKGALIRLVNVKKVEDSKLEKV